MRRFSTEPDWCSETPSPAPSAESWTTAPNVPAVKTEPGSHEGDPGSFAFRALFRAFARAARVFELERFIRLGGRLDGEVPAFQREGDVFRTGVLDRDRVSAFGQDARLHDRVDDRHRGRRRRGRRQEV